MPLQLAITAKVKNVVRAVQQKTALQLFEVQKERKITETIQQKISGVHEKKTLDQLQAEFIERKENDDITPRSIRQLKIRTDAFLCLSMKAYFISGVWQSTLWPFFTMANSSNAGSDKVST